MVTTRTLPTFWTEWLLWATPLSPLSQCSGTSWRMFATCWNRPLNTYNLCSEWCYNIQGGHLPFQWPHPPEFGQMKPFSEDVDRWLDEHQQNVAVVHCKVGKGTGLMICAYMLHRGIHTTAKEVLGYYGSMRTRIRMESLFPPWGGMWIRSSAPATSGLGWETLPHLTELSEFSF